MLEVLLGHLVHVGHQVVKEKLDHARGLGLLLLGITLGVERLKEERAKFHHRVPDVFGHADVASRCASRADVTDHDVNACRGAAAEELARTLRKVILGEKARTLGIVDVVAHVGNAVRAGNNPALKRLRALRAGVAEDAVAHLPGEVKAPPVLLQALHQPHALSVVSEDVAALVGVWIDTAITSHGTRESAFPAVSKGRVAKIVAQCDSLGKVLVESKRTRDAPGNLRDFKRVSEPRAVVVALWGKEDLRLVGQAPEALAVEDAVAVTLIARPEKVFLLGHVPALRLRALCRLRREELLLASNLILPVVNPHGRLHHAGCSDKEQGERRQAPPPLCARRASTPGY